MVQPNNQVIPEVVSGSLVGEARNASRVLSGNALLLMRVASLVIYACPLHCLCSCREREISDDLGVTKFERVGESSADPFGRIFQSDPGVEVHDDFGSILEEPLRVAGPFCPSVTSVPDVRLHFLDTPIGAGGWKALGFDPQNLWIKIFDDGLHVVAIDCREELLEYFYLMAHVFHPRSSLKKGDVHSQAVARLSSSRRT